MISKKCNYALRAVLALARNAGGRPMTIQQIADAESIPARFLEAILRDLKQAGLTESVRGKDGGYHLHHTPKAISVGDVVRAVEGPWFAEAVKGERDVFAAVWEEADAALSRVLDTKDFPTLIAEQDALRRSEVIDYSI